MDIIKGNHTVNEELSNVSGETAFNDNLQRKSEQKTYWKNVNVWDSDGNRITDTEEILRHYNQFGEMNRAYLYDTKQTIREDETVWDAFHEDFRHPWEAGPDVDEIDWTGL